MSENDASTTRSSPERIARLRWRVRLRRHPSAILLLVQLIGLLLYPLLEGVPAGRMLLGTFGVIVLILAIATVHRTPGHAWISAALAVPAVLLQYYAFVRDAPMAMAVSAAIEAVFYFYAAGSLIAYMLGDRRATTDELFAAGATFTLLAWGYAYVHLLCQIVVPGSYTAAVDPALPRTWTELMFLSFTTLSSTGIGDVIPVKPMARALVSLEMFTGVMYIAIIVSRLIGLSLLKRSD